MKVTNSNYWFRATIGAIALGLAGSGVCALLIFGTTGYAEKEEIACTTSASSVLMQETVKTGSELVGTTSAYSTTTTTTTTTTMTTTMVETVLTTEPPQEVTEMTIAQTEYQEPVAYDSYNDYITDYEHVLLCNLVAHEYGSDTHGIGGPPVTLYERACVIAVVMNRVNDTSYPNTIEGVVTQRSQFSGYCVSSYYWDTVTQNVLDSVDYYFSHQDEFPYYLSFYGDGAYNHFS